MIQKLKQLYGKNKDYIRIDALMYLVMIIIITIGLCIIA